MPNEPVTKEKLCNKKHVNIEDAIHHAHTNLGGHDIEPLWVGWGRSIRVGSSDTR